MNAPTPASSTHTTSNPANSAFAHPARIEDSDRSLVTRLASSSIDKLDGLIAELKEMREVLRSEGERVQREVGDYAQFAQTALAATKAIIETVSLASTTDVAVQAQNSRSRRPSGGHEKLRRWPAPPVER